MLVMGLLAKVAMESCGLIEGLVQQNAVISFRVYFEPFRAVVSGRGLGHPVGFIFGFVFGVILIAGRKRRSVYFLYRSSGNRYGGNLGMADLFAWGQKGRFQWILALKRVVNRSDHFSYGFIGVSGIERRDYYYRDGFAGRFPGSCS